MNKFLVLTGAALCLSLSACGSPHDDNSTGYPDSSANHPGQPTTMNTEGRAPAGDYRYRDGRERMAANSRYWFNQIDRGHKGYITRADMRVHAGDRFSEMDANGDGRVTFDEFVEFKRHEFDDYRAHHGDRDNN